MPWSGPEPCPPRLQGPVAGRLFVLEPVAWISHLSPGTANFGFLRAKEIIKSRHGRLQAMGSLRIGHD